MFKFIEHSDKENEEPVRKKESDVQEKTYFSDHTGTFKGKTWTIDLKDGMLKNEMGISVYKGTWGSQGVIFKAEYLFFCFEKA
jgi:hypothetical protein